MIDSNEILNEFIAESKGIIEKCTEILDEVENHLEQAPKLLEYGNLIGRIMDGALIIGNKFEAGNAINLLADYAAICKAVGYKASQIVDNEQFFDISVALLQDATENLESLLSQLEKPLDELKKTISGTFIDRLRWVSKKFNNDYRANVESGIQSEKVLEQTEIDMLMKKMGF